MHFIYYNLSSPYVLFSSENMLVSVLIAIIVHIFYQIKVLK